MRERFADLTPLERERVGQFMRGERLHARGAYGSR
jgi:hypothetical protein